MRMYVPILQYSPKTATQLSKLVLLITHDIVYLTTGTTHPHH